MARLSIDIEQEFRAAFVAYLSAITLTGNVFDRRRLFNSRQDFFERTGVENADDELKIRYTEIECLSPSDHDAAGFDDNPAAVLRYNLHLFHEFEDLRSDNGNSDRDFTDLLLQLRNKILQTPKLTLATSGWKVEIEPLTPPEGTPFTQFGTDSLVGVNGHFTDYTVQATFYEQ
jgi:hypothetical protein